VATPFGALAFLLSWTIKDIPLRTTAAQPDPADTLAPTARPTIRTSDQEMERALTRLLGREQRREVYARLVTTAGIAASPRAAWMLLRVGQHPETSRRDLAGLLHLTDAELERRLTELVAIGYVRALRADLDQPVPLTEAGQHAFDVLFRARQESVARLAGDWDPDKHPALMSLLDRLTHQLATSGETPGPDLDHAGAAAVPRGSAEPRG